MAGYDITESDHISPMTNMLENYRMNAVYWMQKAFDYYDQLEDYEPPVGQYSAFYLSNKADRAADRSSAYWTCYHHLKNYSPS